MLKLSIWCTRFEIIIVIVHLGVVKIYVAAVEALREMEIGDQNRMKLSLAQKVVHFWVLFFFFWHKWKEFIAKRNKNSKPPEREECHHTLETLINEAPLGPIITPPNKATYSDTNNLVPTSVLIKLLKKCFFFFALGVFLISLIHLFQAAVS
jgi:hypothetical protein